eukprot:scaffold2667_cov72-Phaeocystis_antarctica.AAC.2
MAKPYSTRMTAEWPERVCVPLQHLPASTARQAQPERKPQATLSAHPTHGRDMTSPLHPTVTRRRLHG